MTSPIRLLGFAFTNADFLFEMDTDGKILFAAGAANDLVKESGEALVGKPAGRLFKPSEGIKFATFAKALKSGDRAGPYKLMLATGTDANLAMFRLPQNGANISCTLARPGTRAPKAEIDPRTGLASRDGFMGAAEKAGNRDALTLVHVPGLPGLCAQLSPDGADAMIQRIGENIRSAGADATGRIGDNSFGALSPATRGSLDLAGKVADAIAAGGLTPPPIAQSRIGLQGAGLSPEQQLVAVRHVVNRFAETGKVEAANGDIAGAFAGMMEETQLRLAAMTRADGALEIAYQPVCDLVSSQVTHHQALARFTGPQDGDETAKFAEALGAANIMDLAVTAKLLGLIERQAGHLAFTISGASLAAPASFGMLAAILAKRRKLAPRILIGVAEVTAIDDLQKAGHAIAVLRAMGYRVGLDEFGASASAIGFLQALPVDFVTFDGALIQQIGRARRDDDLLAGLAKLCGEMGITTIAAGIENEAMAKSVRAMGFRQGQGKWLGGPMKEIPPAPAAVGKRQGVKESWS